MKDKEIEELKEQLRNLTGQQVHVAKKVKTYNPKTRPEVPLADYVVVPPDNPVPEGFERLALGTSIAVRPMWLHNVLSSLGDSRLRREKKAEKKKKHVREDRSCEIIKRLMDGFFDVKDLLIDGGTSAFKNHPVYLSLQGYATQMLNMKIPEFNRCWNTKMCSARRTVIRLKSAENTKNTKPDENVPCE